MIKASLEDVKTLYYFLVCRRRQVHRKTVCMFPGNKIPIIRGNAVAKRQFEELVQSCRDLLKPEIGYDEGKDFIMVNRQEFSMQKKGKHSPPKQKLT